jgi:hypothetical protein
MGRLIPESDEPEKGCAWMIFAFFLGIALCILATKV